MHRLDIGAETGAHPRVLLLAPSGGLGGGIERYLATVEERLRAGGAVVHRVDLRGPDRPLGTRARLRFTGASLRAARRLRPLDAVVTGHPGLVPVAAAVAAAGGARRAPVLFYGADIWRSSLLTRALLARHRALRPLTISSFSAGALSGLGATPVLRPGLPSTWRATLLAAGARAARETHAAPTGPRLARDTRPPTILTVFRLSDHDWTTKGLPELLAALPAVRRAVGDVRLVVAGRGPAPVDLRAAVAADGGATLVESPDDAELAALYAGADLCVLCTRTRPGSSGEGYGIVLTEAQLAGCPVVGPVSGGARDAYLDGVTGATPGDESPEALAAVLRDLLTDRARLARMRRRAAEWARMATEPAEHTRAVFTAVLGIAPVTLAASQVPTGWTAPTPRPAAFRTPAADSSLGSALSPRPAAFRTPAADSTLGSALTPRPAAFRTPAADSSLGGAPARRAARVWPENDDIVVPDVDDLATYDLEASRGWSDDIEADDLAGR
jgi:glycosyltransferase involved in cell wall biosynthesis